MLSRAASMSSTSSMSRWPASFAARCISDSSSSAASTITFTGRVLAATTASTSRRTASSSPPFSRPTFITASSSSAPSATAIRASSRFAAVVAVPCGNPITVASVTSGACALASVT